MSFKLATARHIPFTRSDLSHTDRQRLMKALSKPRDNGAKPLSVGLEQRVEEIFDVRHALLTTSLDCSLRISARVLAWGPGDEVIVPSFASMSVAAAVLDRGASPVFADIDEATWNIDPVDVASRIASRTRAIIPVHYAGQSCDMLLLADIARRFRLAIVEVAPQSAGAKFDGKYLGTCGAIGCFGFHVASDVAQGELSVFVTNDAQLAAQAAAVRTEEIERAAQEPDETGSYAWLNGQTPGADPDVLTALAHIQIGHFEAARQKSRAIWWHYQDLLSDLAQAGHIILPWVDMRVRSDWHTYAFRVADPALRDPLLAYLKRQGVQAAAHFTPLHSSALARRHRAGAEEELPITDRVSSSLVRLPLYPDLSLEDQDYVIEQVIDFFRHQPRV